MPKHNKGKPGGKFADSKRGSGRKDDYKRSEWPDDGPTQPSAESGQQQGEDVESAQRNHKAGSPV